MGSDECHGITQPPEMPRTGRQAPSDARRWHQPIETRSNDNSPPSTVE